MGIKNAYKGIFSPKVVLDFNDILKTEKVRQYIRIQWGNTHWLTL